jgi:hypothetical protein
MHFSDAAVIKLKDANIKCCVHYEVTQGNMGGAETLQTAITGITNHVPRS